MEKTPISMAINTLEEFKKLLEFSSEAQTSVQSSINILNQYLKYEREVISLLIYKYFDEMTTAMNNSDASYSNSVTIDNFLNNIYGKLAEEPNAETPEHGSYEHLQSLARGRSKN